MGGNVSHALDTGGCGGERLFGAGFQVTNGWVERPGWRSPLLLAKGSGHPNIFWGGDIAFASKDLLRLGIYGTAGEPRIPCRVGDASEIPGYRSSRASLAPTGDCELPTLTLADSKERHFLRQAVGQLGQFLAGGGDLFGPRGGLHR